MQTIHMLINLIFSNPTIIFKLNSWDYPQIQRAYKYGE